MPGFDDSYKSASTYQFQLSAMDPKRDDAKIYDIAYCENDSQQYEIIEFGGYTVQYSNGNFIVNGNPVSETQGRTFLLVNGKNGFVSIYQPTGDDDPFADIEKIDPNSSDTFDVIYSFDVPSGDGTIENASYLYSSRYGTMNVEDYAEMEEPAFSGRLEALKDGT